MGAKLDADVAGAGAVDTSNFSGEEHEQLFQAFTRSPGGTAVLKEPLPRSFAPGVSKQHFSQA